MSELSGLAELLAILTNATGDQLRSYAADVRAFAASQKAANRGLLVQFADVVDRMADKRRDGPRSHPEPLARASRQPFTP